MSYAFLWLNVRRGVVSLYSSLVMSWDAFVRQEKFGICNPFPQQAA